MSIRVMSLVFEAQLPDVLIQDQNRTVTGPLLKLTLLALADHANDEGEGAYPSLTRLELKTALGRQSVVNALTALKQAGLIIRNGISKRGTVDYTLSLTALQALVHQVDSRVPASPPGGLALVHQVDSPSPPGGLEPSFNRPLTVHGSVRSAKNNEPVPLLLSYLRTASENLPIDWRRYEAFEQQITELDQDGATIIVHVSGDQAGYYQDRWAQTMSRCLVGILNKPDAAVRFVGD